MARRTQRVRPAYCGCEYEEAWDDADPETPPSVLRFTRQCGRHRGKRDVIHAAITEESCRFNAVAAALDDLALLRTDEDDDDPRKIGIHQAAARVATDGTMTVSIPLPHGTKTDVQARVDAALEPGKVRIR